MHYVLRGKEVVRAISMEQWAREFENDPNRILSQTSIGCYKISTVFLGLDHNFDKKGPPLVFETMIFGEGQWDQQQYRYSTYEEAMAGHQAACELIERSNADDEAFGKVKKISAAAWVFAALGFILAAGYYALYVLGY